MNQRHPHAKGDDTEALVTAFRAWLLDGPDNSTLTFSKCGGSVTLQASAVHGAAMDLLQRMATQE